MMRRWDSERLLGPHSASSLIPPAEETPSLPKEKQREEKPKKQIPDRNSDLYLADLSSMAASLKQPGAKLSSPAKIRYRNSEEELEPREKPEKTEFKLPPLPQGPIHAMQQASRPFMKKEPEEEMRKLTGKITKVPAGAALLMGMESSSPPTVCKWEQWLEQRKATIKLKLRVPALPEIFPKDTVDISPALSEVTSTPDISDRSEVTISDPEYERKLKKFHSLVKQQNHLLRVSFLLLLNLAESLKLEERMAKKNIVEILLKCLNRDDPELLLVLLTFLTKLSQMRENVDSMIKLNVVEKLQRLVSWPSVGVSNVSLKLMMNLSFNGCLRAKMIDIGMIPHLVKILATGDTRLHATVYSILYHFSLSDQAKAMFTDTGCIQIAMRQVMHRAERGEAFPLAVALLVNLALNEQNARKMLSFNYREGDPDLSATKADEPDLYVDGVFKSKIGKDQGFVDLFWIAKDDQNPLVMKIVRNISHHEPLHNFFWEYINNILASCKKSENEDYVVEGLAIFGNIIMPRLDYERLFRHYDVIDFFKCKLIPGAVVDDVLLELVKIFGTVAAESHYSTEFLCREDFVLPFVRILKDKKNDDEFVLQLLYFIFHLLKHEKSRKYVLQETDAAAVAFEFMHHKNEQVSRACDAVLDMLVEYDEDWRKKIIFEKFKHHNKVWLEMVSKPDEGDNGPDGDDYTGDIDDPASGFINNSLEEEPEISEEPIKFVIQFVSSSDDKAVEGVLHLPYRKGLDSNDY
ncbi:kinesin-associated protein 3-like [Ischnura elegans]|uniref:kinesin-associated protein 3-like n=1 Tax=Ischnura elegans TaxID=197161 RepID=UPI001ED8B9BA|nr:kinesin-associated protein 3-like [Ischnura elegans]